ncbi:MAG: hypothetical protein IJP15_02710 [Oscillospiraceae bacterium]|nr:hypothetical protein [Oscillospiraceae bacterium]
MKKANITIAYDAEKLSALKLYLGQKNLSVEAELVAATDNLYIKTVPANVRDFIELQAGNAKLNERKKKEAKPQEEAEEENWGECD